MRGQTCGSTFVTDLTLEVWNRLVGPPPAGEKTVNPTKFYEGDSSLYQTTSQRQARPSLHTVPFPLSLSLLPPYNQRCTNPTHRQATDHLRYTWVKPLQVTAPPRALRGPRCPITYWRCLDCLPPYTKTLYNMKSTK